MRLDGFRRALRRTPLVASVQASPNSALSNDVHALTAMARASSDQGVEILRAEGVEAIKSMKKHCADCAIIGLIKRDFECGNPVRITPTLAEINDLLGTGCEVIALDGTTRSRPGGEQLEALIKHVHDAGRLVLADCDSIESMNYSVRCGADMVGSTLAGYTDASQATHSAGPDLDLVRNAAATLAVPVLAEGRMLSPAHVLAAMRAGAEGVVVGGTLNDPVKTTNHLLKGALPMLGARVSAPSAVTNSAEVEDKVVGAFDLGGTWLRYGRFDSQWQLQRKERIRMPSTQTERMEWMRAMAQEDQVQCIGVSTGGVVDPSTGVVIEAKEEVMPEHLGSDFIKALDPTPTVALNDGLATAWAHACLPQFAGRRIATLALGTGVGCGFVDENMRILGLSPYGYYPRLNDLLAPVGVGEIDTFEHIVGGLHLTKATAGEAEREQALRRARGAAEAALAAVCALWMPDVVVVAGGVGLGAGLLPLVAEAEAVDDAPPYIYKRPGVGPVELVPSPLGLDAGLHAAAALALFDPRTML